MQSPIDKGVVLVTGASAGIGRALAREAAGRAEALVLVARRRERLVELAGELRRDHPALRVAVEVADVGDTASLGALADRVLGAFGRLDVLVNNAGVGAHALFEASEWSSLEAVVRTNVLGPLYLIRRFLPAMVARGRGGVLNVSSGAAVAPLPGEAAYSATKHFLRGLGKTLQLELTGTGVRLTEVLPGPVATEFDGVAGITEETGFGLEPLRISAEQCAREALRGFDEGRAEVYPGRANRWAMRARPLLPTALERRMMRRPVAALRAAAPRGAAPGPARGWVARGGAGPDQSARRAGGLVDAGGGPAGRLGGT